MKFKQLFFKKRTLGLPLSWFLLLLAALGLTAAMLLLQVNGLAEVLDCVYQTHFLMFALNFLPIFLLMTLLFFATGNAVISVGVTGFLVIALSLVNRFKMIFRNDPFMPWDIMLGGEFMGIAKSLSPKLIIGVLLGLLFIIAAIVMVFLFVKNKKMSIRTRIIGAAATVVIILICNNLLMSSHKINNSLYVRGNIYNQTDQYNSKGFVYQFIYTYNTGKITKPAGYDKSKIEALAGSITITDTERAQKKPHVFIILGEAFSELPLSPVLSYDGFADPLQHYKAMKAESDINGYLVVPNMGGGTADTEFDILTGINTRNFRGMPYSNMLITKSMDAMPHVMSELGYKTAAMHPGHAWFYGRQNVFPFLGFETFTTLSSFNEADNKGMYINEKATYDRIINDFRNHLTDYPDEPLFEFIITIQNHGPYEGKYGSGVKTNFHSTVDFNEKDTNALSNYLVGVTDMDEQLGRLIDEMKNTDEAVVIAYFGDHLPTFSQSLYSALVPSGDETTIEGKMRLYRTPYVIWSNDAAKELLNRNENSPNDENISSFYFGAMLMEYLGFGQVEPFFGYLNTLKNELPVILENEYFTSDGVLHDKAAEATVQDALYEQWAYYRVYDSSSR